MIYIPIVCQARPTWNKCNKKFASLGAEMALFGRPCQTHQLAHSFQHCWQTFDVDIWVAPATAWQTEEENPCLHSTHHWADKGLNADMADPWAHGLPKHPQPDLLWWDTTKEHLPTCWELWEAKEPPSNMEPPEVNVWVDHWHVLPETWTEPEELEPEEETHNLPEKSKDGWRHSTPRPPQAVEFPSWNIAGIE